MEFKVEDVGKKVKDQGGKIYEVVAFQENPSVDLKNIETGNELNIANRCLIADGMKIYEEKDNWNLADSLEDIHNNISTVGEIKTFIQKVKEDVRKVNDIDSVDMDNILDKRAGDL